MCGQHIADAQLGTSERTVLLQAVTMVSTSCSAVPWSFRGGLCSPLFNNQRGRRFVRQGTVQGGWRWVRSCPGEVPSVVQDLCW